MGRADWVSTQQAGEPRLETPDNYVLSESMTTDPITSFLQAGCARVYIVARSEGPLNSAAKALNALPNKGPDAQAIAIVADISSQDGCTKMAVEISKTTDRVDIFVANAGATFIGDMDAHKEDDFDRVMKMNVSSIFFSAQK